MNPTAFKVAVTRGLPRHGVVVYDEKPEIGDPGNVLVESEPGPRGNGSNRTCRGRCRNSPSKSQRGPEAVEVK